jgi:hypothetical protein
MYLARNLVVSLSSTLVPAVSISGVPAHLSRSENDQGFRLRAKPHNVVFYKLDQNLLCLSQDLATAMMVTCDPRRHPSRLSYGIVTRRGNDDDGDLTQERWGRG